MPKISADTAGDRDGAWIRRGCKRLLTSQKCAWKGSSRFSPYELMITGCGSRIVRMGKLAASPSSRSPRRSGKSIVLVM